jgi:hypothetical protein
VGEVTGEGVRDIRQTNKTQHMKKTQKFSLNMFERIDTFGTEQQDKLQISPRIAVLFAENKTNITAIHAASAEQVSGDTTSHSGTEQRAQLAAELTHHLRVIAGIARELDPVQYPGVAEKFPTLRKRLSYPILQSRALAFAQDAVPYKQAFLDRDMPADFIEQLNALVTSFAAATGVKNTGTQERAHSVASVATLVRKGMRTTRELRASLRRQLAKNPALEAAWKRAARVQGLPTANVEGRKTKVEGPGADAVATNVAAHPAA